MKWLKFLLLLVALGIGAYFLLLLIGFIYSIAWYIFWFGLIAIGGTVGYKLLISGEEDEKPKLEAGKPTAISEFEDADRALEELKRKYLPEDRK